MGYTEFSTVEEPIIEWLNDLGWTRFESDKLERDLDEFHVFTVPARVLYVYWVFKLVKT